MDMHTVSSDCVALLVDAGEAPDLESAAALVRSALVLKGVKPWGGMEIDLFSGDAGTLIIATPRHFPRITVADYALPFLRRNSD